MMFLAVMKSLPLLIVENRHVFAHFLCLVSTIVASTNRSIEGHFLFVGIKLQSMQYRSSIWVDYLCTPTVRS